MEGKLKFADEVIREIEAGSTLPPITTETTKETLERFEVTKKRMYINEEFIRKLIREELEKQSRQIVRVIKIREESYHKCKTEILNLVRKRKKGITTLEIAEELNIEPEIVLKILTELREEGKIVKIDERN